MMVEKILKISLSSLMILLLSSCSIAGSWVYERLDSYLADYFKEFADFSKEQNQEIELISEEFLNWFSENELLKIKLLIEDLKKIDLLIDMRTNDDFNLLKDEALNGNRINTNRLLADTVFEIENNIYYLNSINQRINKLNEIQNMKQGNLNINSIISNLKPPVFWKDKPNIIEQAKKWNPSKVQVLLKKTFEMETKS